MLLIGHFGNLDLACFSPSTHSVRFSNPFLVSKGQSPLPMLLPGVQRDFCGFLEKVPRAFMVLWGYH